MILLKVENMSEHKSSALVDKQMDRACSQWLFINGFKSAVFHPPCSR